MWICMEGKKDVLLKKLQAFSGLVTNLPLPQNIIEIREVASKERKK